MEIQNECTDHHSEREQDWRTYVTTFPYLIRFLTAHKAYQKLGTEKLVTSFGDVDTMTPLMRRAIVNIIGEDRMLPKVIQQFRATRRTEREDKGFKISLLNRWLGQSSKVAADHYDTEHEGDWELATTQNDDTPITISDVSCNTGL